MWLIFNTKMLIFRPQANLNDKILFGKINHQLGPDIRKILVRVMFGTRILNSILVYDLL